MKVATPAVVVPVHPERVPPAGLVPIASDTVLVFVVTVLPPASWMVTTGCVPKTSPATVVPGDVVNPSWNAGPTVMLNGALGGDGTVRLSAASVAVRVYPFPALSILQPAKVATPLVVVLVQPERVPLPGLVPMASVTVALSPCMTLPEASSIQTVGWVVSGVPPVPLPGCCLNTSCAGTPAVMLNGFPATGVLMPSVGSVTDRV